MYYVYEWFNKKTGYIFYVGKGCRKRFSSTSHRNKLFKEYIKKNICACRIVKTFSSEESAFAFEHERIMFLKQKGQASCNLDNGGKGGCHFIWTDDMRKYKAQYNPMKEEKQRKRMSKCNPMKNKEIAEKVARKTGRPVIINSVYYYGVAEAARVLGKAHDTIIRWCRKGYDSKGNCCRYEDETQKDVSTFRKAHPLATTPKAVIIDGKLFFTLSDGAKHLGVEYTRFCKLLQQGRSLKGHKCSYANQQPS